MIAIFSGVQLFALGIFGEYLARMHFRAMDRPAYIVTETTPPPQAYKPSHGTSARNRRATTSLVSR